MTVPAPWRRSFVLIGVLCLTGCTDEASPLGLSEAHRVESIILAGVRASQDFTTSGEVIVNTVPLTADSVVAPAGVLDASVAGIREGYQGTATIGRVQHVTRQRTLAAAILLDSSGSMADNDPQRKRVSAAETWIDGTVDRVDEYVMAAFDFNTNALDECLDHTRVLQNYTSDADALREAVHRTVELGGTPLYFSAAEVIEDLGLRYRTSAYERFLLLLSDGEDTEGGSPDEVIAAARAYEVTVVSVALGSSVPDQSLARIAQETGGTTVTVLEAAELESTFGAISTAMNQTSLQLVVRLSPVPPSGERVDFTLSLRTPGGSLELPVRFTAP